MKPDGTQHTVLFEINSGPVPVRFRLKVPS